LGLNKNSKNKDAAIKFLNWLSGAEAMETYALSGGSPAMAKSITDKISGDRPDLIKLGDFAGNYGFVMNGGTSAAALQIYTLQAEQFTGYWSGTKSLDETLQATSKGMADLLK
jgi:multiple sugar transport system substrate-binding protein